jgi:WD40 repeat protein
MPTVKMHKSAINQCELAYPYLFTAGNDGKISVYNLITKKIERTFVAHEEGVNGLKYLAKSKSLLSIGNEGMLKKWDPSSGKVLLEVDLGFKELNCFDTDPFEMFCFVGSKQKKISVIDLDKMQVIKLNSSGTSGIKSLCYEPLNYSLILGEYDGSVSMQEIKVHPINSSVMELRESIFKCSGTTVQEEIDALILTA